jgi:topoisomerase IA-like protein
VPFVFCDSNHAAQTKGSRKEGIRKILSCNALLRVASRNANVTAHAVQDLIEMERQRKDAAAKEAADAASWAEGARDNSKDKAAHDREEEKRRKAAEKG